MKTDDLFYTLTFCQFLDDSAELSDAVVKLLGKGQESMEFSEDFVVRLIDWLLNPLKLKTLVTRHFCTYIFMYHAFM